MSETNRTLKKFLGFSIGPVINIIIGLISVPITTRLLIPTAFGQAQMYTLARGLLMPIIFLGFPYAYTIEYGDTEDKKRLLKHCLLPSLLFLSITGIFLFYFRDTVSHYMFEEHRPDLVLALPLNLLTQLLFQYSMLMLRMNEKAKLYSLYQIIQRLLSFIFTVGLLFFVRKSFEMIIWGQVLTYIAMSIILIPQNFKDWKISGAFKWEYLSYLLKIGLPMVPAGLSMWLIASVDKIALRHWSDFQQIGYYSGAMKIIVIVDVIQKTFETFWIPTLLRYNKEDKVGELVSEIGERIVFLAVVASMCIILFKDIIIHYLGSKFHPSVVILPFLIFIPVMNTVATIYKSGIIVTKRTIFQPLLLVIIAIINIIFNALLVPKYHGLGAAIATAISFSVYPLAAAFIGKRIWKPIGSSRMFLGLILFIVMSCSTLLPFMKWYYQVPLLVMVLAFNKSSIIWGINIAMKKLNIGNQK